TPVREGVDVLSVDATSGGFVVRTSGDEFAARSVVLSTGAYQRPHRPHAGSLPAGLFHLDVSGFRNPEALPAGAVLIVGSGQSGCQIAEELHQSGRDVVLSCGRAPWLPRRIAGRDFVWWSVRNGFLDMTVGSLASPAARL